MDTRSAITAYFGICASGILFANLVPALSSRFVTYGSRASNKTVKASPSDTGSRSEVVVAKSSTSIASTLLDYVAMLRVSHGWFEHFYIISLLSSVFWAYQIAARGHILEYLVGQDHGPPSSSMTLEQVVLTWALMTFQGGRRLYESVTMTRQSQSTMWFLHWVLGICFYVAMGMAVWIEGSPVLRKEAVSYRHFIISAPSLHTLIGLPIFILASGIQHDCHSYLASLKKYSLPVHPIFQQIVCPHYFAECIIYLSLSVVAAPQDKLLNKTILSALLFVAVNLGVTAEKTKQWYANKFGEESVKDRWRMIPLVF